MEQYLIYLRKSRKDRDQELQTGNFDTLQRHRDTLLGLAKQRGYSIAHIYEEVVSGDTISDRPEMQNLLAAVETGKFTGVLVMEVPRLARGNTQDQGIVSETFKYTNTKIITPEKVFDPSDEADEEYFEFGLFMSRREYKAINRRLQRGRMASLSEGKYIAGSAPYGYRRVRIPHQRGYTLEIIPETAEVVQEIFRLYTAGEPAADGTSESIGSYGIANSLNARNIPSPGGISWTATAVRDILKNPTYAGYIRWSYRPDKKQMVDGVLMVSHPVNKDSQLQKGIHPPIITEDIWTAAQSILNSRSLPPVPSKKQLSNPLAGILRCSVCGRSLVQLPQGSHGAPLVMCPTAKCPTVGSRRDVVEDALLQSLRAWLQNYKIDLGSIESANSTAEAIRNAEQQISKLTKVLNTLHQQREKLYDLLEQGVYTQDVFLDRSRVLASRITEAESQFKTLSDHMASLQKSNDVQKQLIPQVQNVLDIYDTLTTPAEKNAMLKAVLKHVVYFKSVGGKWKESDLKLYIYPKLSAPA